MRYFILLAVFALSTVVLVSHAALAQQEQEAPRTVHQLQIDLDRANQLFEEARKLEASQLTYGQSAKRYVESARTLP